MIRRIARVAAPAAVAIDGFGAWLDWRDGRLHLSLTIAAAATAVAMVPCALGFLAAIGKRLRAPVLRHGAVQHGSVQHGPVRSVAPMRLPLVVPRGYVGAAVLGGIATLAAMGEAFGLYIFLGGVALIALALSQATSGRG